MKRLIQFVLVAALAVVAIPSTATAAVRSGSVATPGPDIRSLDVSFDDVSGTVTVRAAVNPDADVLWELAPACDISSDVWGHLESGTATATIWDPDRNRVRRELTGNPTSNLDGTLTVTFAMPEIAGQDLRCVSGGSIEDNDSDFAFFFAGYPARQSYPKPFAKPTRRCGKTSLYGGTAYVAAVKGFPCAKARRYARTGDFPRGHCFLDHPGQSRNGISLHGRMLTMSCGPWRHTDEGDTIALRYVVLSNTRYPAVRRSVLRRFLDLAAARSHRGDLEMPGGADQHDYSYGYCGFWLKRWQTLRYTKRRVRCNTAVDWWYGNGRTTCTSYVTGDYYPRSGRWRLKTTACWDPETGDPV